MRTPQKYYQICTVREDGTFGLFETHQFGDKGWFTTQEEAEEFINEYFWDHDPPQEKGGYDTLVILPIYTVKLKNVK